MLAASMAAAEPKHASPAVRAAARSLAIDRVTAEVVTAFAAAGFESLLLKGPSLSRWLYADGTSRPYLDSDLLVAASCMTPARTTLKALGFTPHLRDEDFSRHEGHHGLPWIRAADGACVDLHHTLAGVNADPEVLWRALRRDAERERVGGADVLVLSRVARCLHVALHAAWHGPQQPKPMADLERALELGRPEDWRAASALAAELGATTAFAAGLGMLPGGSAYATAPEEVSPQATWVRVRVAGGNAVADGFARVGTVSSTRGRAALLARLLIPSRRYMRASFPRARRGAAGLGTAYVQRWIRLAYEAPSGARAWRAAARRGR
jgi:hypothetical protein